MNNAIAQARSTLDGFIKELDNPKSGARYMVKVGFRTDAGEREHIWVDEVSYRNGQFSGRLTDEPMAIKSLKQGQQVTAKREEISDWAVFQNGAMRGGYTDALLLRREQQQRP